MSTPIRKVGKETPISDSGLQQPRQRGIALQRGEHAHRNAQRQRKQRGDEGELERRGHAFADQLGDRLLELIGDAEVEVRRVGEKARRLHDRRLIETQLMTQLLALEDRGFDAHHLIDGIADEAEHRERDQPHRDHDADRREEAVEREGDHGAGPAVRCSRGR